MGKKKIAIAYGILDNYVDILSNTLIGLVKHSPKFWDDVIVFHKGLNDFQKENINKIVKCTFIEVNDQNFIKYISKEQLKLYSAATFFRFESFKLLDKYHKVIWSDVDVLYQKDISTLAKYGDKTGYASTIASSNYRVIDNFYSIINEYNMFGPMYNAGLFVITDKLKNYNNLSSWCYQTTKKYSSKLKWLDQGVLNLLIQEFNINVEEIELEKYHCHPSDYSNSKLAYIIHAHGTRKFWNDKEYKQNYIEWFENEQKWIEISKKQHKNNTKRLSSSPLVSVLMSINDRNQFFEEAITSILNQTYGNFEFLIVVEKTKMQTKIQKQLNNFKDKRIKIYYNKENIGLSNSLNKLVENSNGKYIARMDDDDISISTRFEKQVDFMEKNKHIGICGTNAEFFMYANGVWFNKNLSSEEIKIELLYTNPICHPSVMMRKEILEKNNLRYDSNCFSEDYDFWSRAIEFTKIENIDEILLKYRASNTNVTAFGKHEKEIHQAVKNIMKKQFLKYLNISFNDNELELIQKRKQIIYPGDYYKSALFLRKQIYGRIINANRKIKFYDHKLIKKKFNYLINPENKSKTLIIKKIIKKVLKKPYKIIENRFNNLIESRTNNLNYRIDLIEEKITNNNQLNFVNKEKKEKL